MSEIKRPQLQRDYNALKFEASVLYISKGLSAEQISKQLNISMPTLQKWNKAGNWQLLRPNMAIVKEYKAAHLYIKEQLTTGEIASRLSVPEQMVLMWIDTNGWETVKAIKLAKSASVYLINTFCQYFTELMPAESAKVELIKNNFLRKTIQLDHK